MNKLLHLPVGVLALHVNLVSADRVEKRNDWTERFAVSSAEPVLEIHNVWGDVRVSPGPEGEITLAIREHRSAPSQALFDRSLEVYGLNIQASDEGVEVQVGERRQSWRGRDPCRHCRVDYQFEVQVPPNTRLFASTVNDGVVEVADILGQVSAHNVNGPVTVRNFSACKFVESINGDVSLSFNAAPTSDCRIETINGDIRVTLPEGSGLDLSVDLGNGRMTSEVPVEPVAIPARVEHRERGGRNQYRIEQAAGIRLAGGGPVFEITSMNGDLRIQKIK